MDLLDDAIWNQIKLFSLRLCLACMVWVVFWVIGAVLARFIMHLANKTGPGRAELLALGAQASRIGIRILGVVTALGTLGVDISALVAGLGLTGFALGFALKDALSNVLAGAMILFYRPFQRGSRITVSGFEGEVIRIDLRYTLLRGAQKDYLLPNSTLLTNPITLHTPSSSD